MEAWIETVLERSKDGNFYVASLVEAWIETLAECVGITADAVASLVEAWIETCKARYRRARVTGRLPRGGVD